MPNLIRKIAALSLIGVSLIILLVSHFLPTCKLDANVTISNPLGGDVGAGLEGKLYFHGFDVKAGVEGGGLMGDVAVDNERFFVQGPPPELAERVGIIMNSYKEKSYPLTPETYDFHNDTTYYAKIEVNTHVDRVPLWVEAIEQRVTITVSINESLGMKQVEITKVWIEVWTDYDEENERYNDKEVVWSKTVSDVLLDENGTATYVHDMKYGSDAKRIGIVSRIECVFTDVNGLTEDDPKEPFISDGHPNPNNIYGATDYQAFKVLLMVLTFPMFIIAALLSIISIVKIARNRKGAVKLLIISAVIIGAGLLFYRWGVLTILDMLEVAPALDLMAEKYFEWNWAVNLPWISVILLGGSSALAWNQGKEKEAEHEEEREKAKNGETERKEKTEEQGEQSHLTDDRGVLPHP